MEIYKKKSLNFSKNLDRRELRAYRRSVDRRNIKHARLSALRGIDDKQIDISLLEGEKKDVSTNKLDKKSNYNHRAEMLKKWKEEKELKRKLELKKPAFVVSRVTYKPTADEFSSLKSVETKKNLQNQSRLPKCAVRTTSLRLNSNAINSKLPLANQSKTLPKNTFKPQTQGQQNKQSGSVDTSRSTQSNSGKSFFKNEEVTKFTHSRNVTVKPPVFKPTLPLCFAPGKAKTAIPRPAVLKNSKAPNTNSRLPTTSQNAKPKSAVSSFAPANFLFKAPVNVQKIIFPNGVPGLSSKQIVRENQEKEDFSKTENCEHKSLNAFSLISKTNSVEESSVDEAKTSEKSVETRSNALLFPTAYEALHDDIIHTNKNDVDAMKAINDSHATAEMLEAAENNPFIIPISLKAMHLPADPGSEECIVNNNIASETMNASNKKAMKKKEDSSDKSAVIEENSLSGLPFVEGKENKPPQNELDIKKNAPEKLEKNIIPEETFGNRELHTIVEDLEISENFPSASKSHRKNVHHTLLTPRRSRRLASMHEKMNSDLASERILEQVISAKVPASHQDLANEMSLLNVKEKAFNSEGEIENLTPVTKNVKRGRPSTRNTKKEVVLPEVMSFDLMKTDSTPNRPMTRQQRKISLLGSPQIPSNLPRKSIRGDLMSFSPET